MKMTKKVLALVMAVLMLASVFAVSASALTYDPTLTDGEIKIILTADKTEVEPGDVVTFSIAVDKGSYGDFGPWMTTLVYNSNQITPTTTVNTTFRQYVNECANFMRQTSTVNFNLPIAQVNSVMTAEEKAYYTNAIMMNGVIDTGLGIANVPGSGWTPVDATTAQCTFQMTIADDVEPGTEIWVGNHEATYLRNLSYMSPAGGTRYNNSVYDLSQSMVMLTVASDEPAGPVVAKSRSQVKMTATSDTTVADAFTFRVISTITDADWDAYFANTAAGGDTSAIQRLGFVAYKGTDGFDMETAKAVAQGTATEGYEVAWTDYVQKADDSSDAYFGARLEITSADTRSDVTYVGVVEYLNADGTTAYAFYDAAEQALLNTNYDTIVADYLARYPYGA